MTYRDLLEYLEGMTESELSQTVLARLPEWDIMVELHKGWATHDYTNDDGDEVILYKDNVYFELN
jgi:hypothetical protein